MTQIFSVFSRCRRDKRPIAMIQKRFSIPKRFLLPIIVLAVALAPWLAKIVLATPAAAPRTRAAQVSDWQRIWRGEGSLNDLVALDAQNALGVGSDGLIISTDSKETYQNIIEAVQHVSRKGGK
jgi:uncharacterized SAM-binding protein YcdF (DUF218 family)